MGEDVAILSIIFGSVVSIVFLSVLGGIIKTWIKRKNSSGDITQNEEFLAALREFKEKTDRRLSNLEAIISDEDQQISVSKESADNVNKEEQDKTIEIEFDEQDKSGEEGKSGNLRNMLNQ